MSAPRGTTATSFSALSPRVGVPAAALLPRHPPMVDVGKANAASSHPGLNAFLRSPHHLDCSARSRWRYPFMLAQPVVIWTVSHVNMESCGVMRTFEQG